MFGLKTLNFTEKRKRVQELDRHEENRLHRLGGVVVLAGVLADIVPVPLPPIPLSNGISPCVMNGSLVQTN